MDWIVLSILAALLWSVVNVVDKYVISKFIDKLIVPVIITGAIGFVASLVIFFTHGFLYLSLSNILLAIVAGFLYILMNILYYNAIKIEEISKVVPLFFIAPIFILVIAAIFLGEVFTLPKYIGIFLLVFGAVLISSKKLSFNFGRAFWIMILAALVLAVNQVITKYLLNFADFWTVFAYIRIGAFIALLPAIIINIKTFKEIFKKYGFKPFGLMIAGESLNFIGTICIALAAVTGFITLVNALSSVQPFFILLFTVLISIFYPQILKEEIGKAVVSRKIIAIAIMFAGVILIR